MSDFDVKEATVASIDQIIDFLKKAKKKKWTINDIISSLEHAKKWVRETG